MANYIKERDATWQESLDAIPARIEGTQTASVWLAPVTIHKPISDRRREKCTRLCPKAMRHFDLLESGTIDADRASGAALCLVCGNALYDHPHHPHTPELTITCSGDFVKL